MSTEFLESLGPRRVWRGWYVIGPVLLLFACAGLLVGSDVLERRWLPDLSTGRRHALLTLRAAIVTGIGCGVIFLMTRRHHRRLLSASEQLQKIRDRMAEQEKLAAIGQVAAGMAHEIGNPLSSISSVVQMIKRKGTGGAFAEQLELIQTHIHRISSTVRQLVTLARPAPQRWEFVDLGAALDEAVRLVSFDRRAKNIEVRREYVELPSTYALRGPMQQVFLNLLLNALDAMPTGGILTIRTAQEDGSLVFSIADTGEGIPPGIGRRVFDAFYTTKEPGRGTGLGLAVSERIVHKHGGSITYESRQGVGTEFKAKIPTRREPPENEHDEIKNPLG